MRPGSVTSIPLFALLFSLLVSGCVSPGNTGPATPAQREDRTMTGQLLTADTHQPLANLHIAIGDTADSHSIFGFVEHHVFAKGRTDEQGRFTIAVPETPEFKNASRQKTLLIVISGNRDYLGILLSQGEKSVYLVPKVVTVQ